MTGGCPPSLLNPLLLKLPSSIKGADPHRSTSHEPSLKALLGPVCFFFGAQPGRVPRRAVPAALPAGEFPVEQHKVLGGRPRPELSQWVTAADCMGMLAFQPSYAAAITDVPIDLVSAEMCFCLWGGMVSMYRGLQVDAWGLVVGSCVGCSP